MDDSHENGYSLKTFTKKFKLPQVVRVVSGIYDMLDEISLSREEILTLHTLKRYETVKASNDEGLTFHLPLNITSKIAIISSELTESCRKTFEDVETLADEFPPLVTSTNSHNWLEIDEGDILKPIQTWITSPREGYLQCGILNKPLHDDILIPLSYQARFETLENTIHNSLFLKEVVSNYPFPIQIRFLENRVTIQKDDINSGRPTSLDTLGIITLIRQWDISLVVATTTDPDSGKAHSLITLPEDLDITVAPYPGSPKRHKKNNRLLELGFCDTNFVYGSTIIEEKPIEDTGADGYEDVLPRLHPRKKPGDPSRFKHKHSPSTATNTYDNSELDCQSNSSHGDAESIPDNVCDDSVQTQSSDDVLVDDGRQYSGNCHHDAYSPQKNDATGVHCGGTDTKQSKEGYVGMNDSVDVVKELAKFKASIKYHYRDKKDSPDKNTTKRGTSVPVNSSGQLEHGVITSCNHKEAKADSNYLEMKSLLQSFEIQEKCKSDGTKAESDGESCSELRESILKSVAVSATNVDVNDISKLKFIAENHSDDYDCNDCLGIPDKLKSLDVTAADNDDLDCDDNYATSKERTWTYVAVTSVANDNDDADSGVDGDGIGDGSEGDKNDVDNSSIDKTNEKIALRSRRSDADQSASGIKKTFMESPYQSLNALTMASKESRLNTLKRLKEQRFSLRDKPSAELESTQVPSHMERPQSDLQGYKIPTRSQSVSGNQSPRTFMRSRTLTDSFLCRPEDDEESGHFRVIKDEKSTSISVNVPDDCDKYLYTNKKPLPTPPHYNTLPASLSKRPKSKSSSKGSLKKLAIFARKGIKRSQSASDMGNYSYAYVVSSEGADKKTEIGKMWDLRKVFEKRNKERETLEAPRDELKETPRERLRALDVDQVCKLLQTLSLHRYVMHFKEAKIDGSMFVDLTDQMMIELQVDKELDRCKIRKAIEEGWLPKER